MKDASERRRRSVEERLGCDTREFRDVVEEEAVEFGCGRPVGDLIDRGGIEYGAGEGGNRSVMPSLCSELRVGI